MANEFKHVSVGPALTQAEFEQIDGHVLNSQQTGDTIRAASATSLIRIANSYVKTAAPSATDDTTAGWVVGSTWIDVTNDVIWVAVDVTASAAIWIASASITSPGTAPGGELGGTWASPTVDTTHSGSSHVALPASVTIDSVPAVTTTGSQTLTNKTLTSPTINTPAMGASSIDAITEIAAAIKSGADGKLVTGTAGSAGALAEWNIDGDVVTSTNITTSSTLLTLANGVEVNLQEDIVWTAAGAATTAGEYSIARDDSTVLHLNVPTGATYELSINDVSTLALSATALTTPVGVILTPVSGQIKFPATANPSSDANTIDDYEEGSWTGTIQDDTRSDGESQTYSTQYGRYQKIGQRVNVAGRIVLSSLGTLTGGQAAVVAGLPFTSGSTNFSSLTFGYAAGLAITALASPGGLIGTSTATIDLYVFSGAAGAVPMTVDNLSADGDIIFVGSYEI